MMAQSSASYSAAFPDAYDPNYFPADTRTFAGAVATPITKDSVTGAVPHTASTAEVVNALISTFDFDTSKDAEVDACEASVFECLRREAAELRESWLTSGLVETCILEHATLGSALASLLSGKVHETLPGSQKYSTAGGVRAESATMEEALRATMLTRLQLPAVRRALVSDLLKIIAVDPAADALLQPVLFFKGFRTRSQRPTRSHLVPPPSARERAARAATTSHTRLPNPSRCQPLACVCHAQTRSRPTASRTPCGSTAPPRARARR